MTGRPELQKFKLSNSNKPETVELEVLGRGKLDSVYSSRPTWDFFWGGLPGDFSCGCPFGSRSRPKLVSPELRLSEFMTKTCWRGSKSWRFDFVLAGLASHGKEFMVSESVKPSRQLAPWPSSPRRLAPPLIGDEGVAIGSL